MSNQNNTLFEELCVGYVLKSITSEEEKEFKLLLKNATPEQEQLYQDMQNIASEMALLTYEQKPSEDVKEQLLQMAWASVNSRHGSNVHYLSRYRIAAAAAVASGLARAAAIRAQSFTGGGGGMSSGITTGVIGGTDVRPSDTFVGPEGALFTAPPSDTPELVATVDGRDLVFFLTNTQTDLEKVAIG